MKVVISSVEQRLCHKMEAVAILGSSECFADPHES